MGCSIISLVLMHFLGLPHPSNLTGVVEESFLLNTPLMSQDTKVTKPSFVEIPATHNMIRNLRDGGYVLYMRHGTTNNLISDRVPKVDLNDCHSQRPLTDEGRQLMAKVGSYLRKARIPIGELRVSPMCRALESAAQAFPKISPVVDHHLMYVANFTEEDKIPIINNTRQLLSAPITARKNRVILAHAPNLMELIGYFPKEGTLVIFRPKGDGSGFEYVGSVAPSAWSGLLK